MPITKLLSISYDSEAGQVEDIVFSDTFLSESPLLQADLLSDIKEYIGKEYRTSLSNWQKELEEKYAAQVR